MTLKSAKSLIYFSLAGLHFSVLEGETLAALMKKRSSSSATLVSAKAELRSFKFLMQRLSVAVQCGSAGVL